MSVHIVDDEQRRDRPQDPAPFGFRRRRGICFVRAPRRCAMTSPASRRLASTPAALGTRPIVLSPRAARLRPHHNSSNPGRPIPLLDQNPRPILHPAGLMI